MAFNLSGTLNFFHALVKPSILVPSITVKDIRQLNFKCFKQLGYNALIFDKDNCLTKPYEDRLLPELKPTWQQLLKTFDRRQILIVSNSAGTRDDPRLIQAESVSRALGVPVLAHSTKKPGCSSAILQHFRSHYVSEEQSLRVLVIGAPKDRTLTDVVLASKLSATKQAETLSVLTTAVWQKEGFGTRFMRLLESTILRLVRRPSIATSNPWSHCVISEEELAARMIVPVTRWSRALSGTRLVLGWTGRQTYRGLRYLSLASWNYLKEATKKLQQKRIESKPLN